MENITERRTKLTRFFPCGMFSYQILVRVYYQSAQKPTNLAQKIQNGSNQHPKELFLLPQIRAVRHLREEIGLLLIDGTSGKLKGAYSAIQAGKWFFEDHENSFKSRSLRLEDQIVPILQQLRSSWSAIIS